MGIKSYIKERIQRVVGVPNINAQIAMAGHRLELEEQQTRLFLGKMLSDQIRQHGVYPSLREAEFKVFSQFGDDGILQYLIHQACAGEDTFIEFGIENYLESNTRFLLMNDNWSGLVIDCDETSLSVLLRDEVLLMLYDLTAVCAFITRENINELFVENGFAGEIGLLSIDIDGNDYWIWEAIDAVSPVIVVVEYNSMFGSSRAVAVPYDPDFRRAKAHYSLQLWGASIKAFCILAEKKGYAFVGCNSAGNNAYFVRRDRIGNIPVKSAEDGYVESKFRDSRDENGLLTRLRGRERLAPIKDELLIDVETGRQVRVAELLPPD